MDIKELSRDVWDVISRFLSLKDLKNLSLVNRVLAHHMKALMTLKFRFVVHGSLADFRALGWTRACLNIRLLTVKSVLDLSEDDVFVDIVFPYMFKPPVQNISWPLRLTHLTVGLGFNRILDNLPTSLTHLAFSWDFNQPVDRLPSSLTHVTFGWAFNKPVNHLPVSAKSITIRKEAQIRLFALKYHPLIKLCK
jgi:hypothetical protein